MIGSILKHKLTTVCIVLFIILLVFIGLIVRQEQAIQQKTKRFENPTLQFNNIKQIEDYLQYSQVVREGAKTGSQCHRPFFDYFDYDTKNDTLIKPEERCKKLEAAEIMALRIKPLSRLGVSHQLAARPKQAYFRSQLNYANGEAINLPHTTVFFGNPSNPVTVRIVYNPNPENNNSIACAITIPEYVSSAQNISGSSNCPESAGSIELMVEGSDTTSATAIATLLIDHQRKSIEFRPQDSGQWHSAQMNNSVDSGLIILCSDADVSGQKIFTYDRTPVDNPAPLQVGCNSRNAVAAGAGGGNETESLRLARLFSKYTNQGDVTSTLDKDLTGGVDSITQRNCGAQASTLCDMKILIMNSTTGAILAMSSTRKAGANNNATPITEEQDRIDNFRLDSAGSTAKIPFAFALLNQNINLKDLRLHNIRAGTPVVSPGAKILTGRILGWDNGARNIYGVYNKSDVVGPLDFNGFIATSSNVYAASLMLLGNYSQEYKVENINSPTMPIKGFGRVNTDGEQLGSFSYLEHRTYYPLMPAAYEPRPTTYNAAVIPEPRGMLRDVESEKNKEFIVPPPWMKTMNQMWGVRFTSPHTDIKQYSPYREYVWGEEIKINNAGLFPWREYFDDVKCVSSGFFGCGMYGWILGQNDSGWSTLALAEIYSSIATNRHIKASLVSSLADRSNISYDEMKVNAILRYAMQGVVSNGTARELSSFNAPTSRVVVIAKTGTPSVQNGNVHNLRVEEMQRRELMISAFAGRQYTQISDDDKKKVASKLLLHPLFKGMNRSQIDDDITNYLRQPNTPPDLAADNQGTESHDEKRLVFVVAPNTDKRKNFDALRPENGGALQDACTIVITTSERIREKYHLKAAKDVINLLINEDYLEKCKSPGV